jgi:hypothetical protein
VDLAKVAADVIYSKSKREKSLKALDLCVFDVVHKEQRLGNGERKGKGEIFHS